MRATPAFGVQPRRNAAGREPAGGRAGTSAHAAPIGVVEPHALYIPFGLGGRTRRCGRFRRSLNADHPALDAGLRPHRAAGRRIRRDILLCHPPASISAANRYGSMQPGAGAFEERCAAARLSCRDMARRCSSKSCRRLESSRSPLRQRLCTGPGTEAWGAVSRTPGPSLLPGAGWKGVDPTAAISSVPTTLRSRCIGIRRRCPVAGVFTRATGGIPGGCGRTDLAGLADDAP